ncbi:MAG: DegT/DnrJ/EryC1/StrS family aminotransferase [Candidatus Acidiferrum sp.]|jgi:perosamine synthetase
MKIPLSSPDITQAEIDAVVAVLRSGRLSLGEKLEEFEAAFAGYNGVPHAAAVSSGTTALHLAIRALGIGEGDEVILPSFTFIAAANALRYERASPVFIDIDPNTLNLDPSRIERAITPRTRAILVVHTFGVPAEMNPVLEIARRRGLLVIEDACEALGAESGGKKTGTFGDAGVFGFYPNKQITTAEGGMVITENADIAARIRSLRNHGRSASGSESGHKEFGYNYRLSELHCALGIEQLKRVKSILRQRESVALGYHRRLRKLPGLQLPLQEIPGGRISWFVYVVRRPQGTTAKQREELIRRLASRGIETGRYFVPIHQQPAYDGVPVPMPLTFTESLAGRTLALPFFNSITDSQLDEVCGALEESLRELL